MMTLGLINKAAENYASEQGVCGDEHQTVTEVMCIDAFVAGATWMNELLSEIDNEKPRRTE